MGITSSAAVAGLALAGCGHPPGALPDDAAPDVAAPDATPIDAAPDASPFDAPPGMADLQFIAGEMNNSVVITLEMFHAGDCEIQEGCVGAAGNRRLVRFDTVSANRGTADIFI